MGYANFRVSVSHVPLFFGTLVICICYHNAVVGTCRSVLDSTFPNLSTKAYIQGSGEKMEFIRIIFFDMVLTS